MVYLIAIVNGYFFALLANYLLDYLPFGRIITNRKVRIMRIKGAGSANISINQPEEMNYHSLYEALSFPICDACHQSIDWKAFLFGAKCQHCGRSAKRRYWLLVIGMPIVFALITRFPIEGFRIADIFLLLTFYIMVFVMDVEHRVILFPLTLVGILFGCYFGIVYHGFMNTLIGGLAGGGIMLFFYWIGVIYIQYIRKTSNPEMDEVALGFGDVSLSLILGFILGWPGILGGLFFGILLGGLISGGLLLLKLFTKKYAPNDLILPYAPFLIIGALLIMIL